ncbi:hypothetical protein AVEN_94658-1, partial [Araneus ventricosus]
AKEKLIKLIFTQTKYIFNYGIGNRPVCLQPVQDPEDCIGQTCSGHIKSLKFSRKEKTYSSWPSLFLSCFSCSCH